MSTATITLNTTEFTYLEVDAISFGENEKLYIVFNESIFSSSKAEDAINGQEDLSIVFKQGNSIVYQHVTNQFEINVNYTKETGFVKQLVATV